MCRARWLPLAMGRWWAQCRQVCALKSKTWQKSIFSKFNQVCPISGKFIIARIAFITTFSASLKSRTPSREVTPAAEAESSDKEKTPTPAPRLSTQSSSDPYPFQAKNIDDDEESQTPSLHDVQKIKSPSPSVEDAPSLEATPTPG